MQCILVYDVLLYRPSVLHTLLNSLIRNLRSIKPLKKFMMINQPNLSDRAQGISQR